MKHVLLASACVLILFSCGKRQNVSIIGKFQNWSQPFVYVEVRGKVDSVEIEENGTFVFEKQFRGPQFIKLYGRNRRNFVMLLCDTTEDIYLEANASILKNSFRVSGSRGTALLHELAQHFSRTQSTIDSLKDVHQQYLQYGNFPDNELEAIQNKVDSEYKILVSDEKKYLINFIVSHKNSLASMTALFQSLDPNGQPLLLEDTVNIKYFLMVDSSLRKRYRFSPYVREFRKSVKKLVASIRKEQVTVENRAFLKIGDKAPSFTLRRADGEKVKLSQYQGKWVFIDFWASWCIQNRENNQQLRLIWKKYHSKNFDIIQISLDKDLQMWQTAVQHDSLPWHGQVSDLRYWESEVINRYAISKIPANVLVNPQGTIVALNLDPDKLESRLKNRK